MNCSCGLFVLLPAILTAATAAADEPLQIEIQTVATGPAQYYFAQARGALIPGEKPRIVVTTQEIERVGSHGFHDWWQVESRDLGRTWSAPERIESLRRTKLPGGDERSIGDLSPEFHAKTGVVLSTGKTFTFRGGTKEDRTAEQVSYAVRPPSGPWSGMRILELPSADHEAVPVQGAEHRLLPASRSAGRRHSVAHPLPQGPQTAKLHDDRRPLPVRRHDADLRAARQRTVARLSHLSL